MGGLSGHPTSACGLRMRTDGTMSWYKDGGALASRPSHSPPAHHGHTFPPFCQNDSKYLTSSKETLSIVEQGRYR